MMAEKFLTAREFDLWKDGHDKKIDRILDNQEAQQAMNLRFTDDIATLEARQTDCAEGVNRRASLISSVVSAVVGAIMGAIFGRT